MIRILFLIGSLLLPVAYAQEETLYLKIKHAVELESQTKETELPLQRFALGVYYDHPVLTSTEEGTTVEFEMEKEEYIDSALLALPWQICADQKDRKNDFATCFQVQNVLQQIVKRTLWHRKLGRDLQSIASGYENGIDGYPGKSVNIIGKIASIAHLWSAANDPYVTPIVQSLTRARPWPEGKQDAIELTAEEIIDMLFAMKRTWNKKEDTTEMTAALWRYRHGVSTVIAREGDCEEAEQRRSKRSCALEEKMDVLLNLLRTDIGETGDIGEVLFPSYFDTKRNIYVWMRSDDVGLQSFIPLDPVQDALTPPEFDDCVEAGTAIRTCYDTYKDMIVRGGMYPSKVGAGLRSEQPHLGVSVAGEGSPGASEEDFEENMRRNSVIEEPGETEGICSHPFGKRGYLCRSVVRESCDLTDPERQQLAEAGTNGIVLTRCQPERFKDDIDRTTSGPDICGRGGWRETVQENLVEDTPERQPDMLPNACAACAIDVVCSDQCDPDRPSSYRRKNGVIEICLPNISDAAGKTYYTLVRELVRAQQACNESAYDTQKRTGAIDPEKKDPAACCAAERPASFAQCTLMAGDGILEQAGISIDQCAGAFANIGCAAHDDNPNDDDYVCTNDGVDPESIADAIDDALVAPGRTLNLPLTCSESIKNPRIQAMYNSLPLVCRPGCPSQYQNTVGNNLCFTGQCLEESFEWSRIIPGRMGVTTIDEDFPWDACVLTDPNLGRFEVPPALTGPKLPLYRPALLMQELDKALCQLNGLPSLSPPILCAFDPAIRIGLPPLSLIESALDIASQGKKLDETGFSIESAASAIGSRVATDMLTQYLRPAAGNFADLLGSLQRILSRVGELQFPTTMCPRYTANPLFCSTLQRSQ